MDDFYRDYILDHYESPYHRGHIEHPTIAHEDENPLCGDQVRLEIVVDENDRPVPSAEVSVFIAMEKYDANSGRQPNYLPDKPASELFSTRGQAWMKISRSVSRVELIPSERWSVSIAPTGSSVRKTFAPRASMLRVNRSANSSRCDAA